MPLQAYKLNRWLSNLKTPKCNYSRVNKQSASMPAKRSVFRVAAVIQTAEQHKVQDGQKKQLMLIKQRHWTMVISHNQSQGNSQKEAVFPHRFTVNVTGETFEAADQISSLKGPSQKHSALFQKLNILNSFRCSLQGRDSVSPKVADTDIDCLLFHLLMCFQQIVTLAVMVVFFHDDS